jgi:hypothetical protein
MRQRLIDEHGVELDLDTVDIRLSQLVELGNLARSPRESEARSIKEYLQHRARYQLTQRGGTVHRMVKELLQHAETAREVSSEMLGGILEDLRELNRIHPSSLAGIAPDDLAPPDHYAVRPVRTAGGFHSRLLCVSVGGAAAV